MKKLLILIGFLLILVPSCGYKLEGGGYVNENVNTIAVEMFNNKTSETRAQTAFTNALIQEIIEKTDTKVVVKNLAKAYLKGTINAITFHTLSRASTEEVIERRVKARIDLELIDKSGNVLWSVKNFSSKEEYSVSADTVTDESNINQAIDDIAQRTAEMIVSRLLDNF
ncbi:MAG: LptE family protein [Desulfobacteraceae bacterium]|nr:LptE family protein [Desulfobacteraceae bacterium]